MKTIERAQIDACKWKYMAEFSGCSQLQLKAIIELAAEKLKEKIEREIEDKEFWKDADIEKAINGQFDISKDE